MGSCPGGVANQAIAAARLGLRTGLAAAFGDDGYGDYNWKILAGQEHVDLSLSRRIRRLALPGHGVPQRGPRPLHGDARPPAPVTSSSDLIGCPPPSLAAVADLGHELEPWALEAHRPGSSCSATSAGTPAGVWSAARLDNLQYFHAFMPNQREAMAFTGHDNPWAALYALADRVPVAVVTLGPQGAMAVDSETGEEEWVPSLPVSAYDPTGAGDCFGAAFIVGCLAGWPLGDRLRFANLCAALAVQEVGGSLAAPGLGGHRRLVAAGQRPEGTPEQPVAPALRASSQTSSATCRRKRKAGDGHHRAPLGRVARSPHWTCPPCGLRSGQNAIVLTRGREHWACPTGELSGADLDRGLDHVAAGHVLPAG